MRLPNNYGSVIKLAGKRRKPFAVRVTTGYAMDLENQKATQKYKYLGYYEKRADAIRALAEYNVNPYNVDASRLTVGEIYTDWKEQKSAVVGASSMNRYASGWNVLSPLEKTPIRDVRLMHLQRVFDESGKTYTIQEAARQLAGQLFEYAIKNDICEKNYARFIDLSKAAESRHLERVAFSADEISRLWAALPGSPRVDIVLMLIYSGLRVGELLALRKEDVHLAERFLEVKKSKTAAGVRRVPIAEKTAPLFERYLSSGTSPALITSTRNKPYAYENYLRTAWTETLQPLGLDSHRPHDTRHTCVSLLAMADVKPELIRAIVGHKGKDLTEDVYTHFDFQLLIDAINKI